MYCYQCDTPNPGHARYCVSCGHALPEAQPAGPPPAVMSPTASFAPAMAAPGGAQPLAVSVRPDLRTSDPTLYFVIRVLYFVFVGLWIGPLWVMIAWLFNLTLIGMPFGAWMLNRLPQIMTLRPRPAENQVSSPFYDSGRPDSPATLLVRAAYFLLIGWWASLLWLLLGWFFAATIIGLPLAFLMFERVGTVTTLAEA
jgi:uncharacterized membrane protein YccF (DUF307 family)